MNRDREEALDRCIDAIQAGESVEDVLRSYPNHAEELRPLLALAIDLKELPDPTPSLRGVMRAMTHVSVESGKKDQARYWARPSFFQPVLMRVVASLAFVFILGWGTSVAASSAAPGDFLYPVKRFTEKARFFLTLNRENQAELRIVFSEERLAEVFKKHVRGEGIDEELLSSMLEEARLALVEIGEIPLSDRNRIIARAKSSSKYQKQVLNDLKLRATETERQQLDGWMSRCDARWQWMSEVREESDSEGSGTSSNSKSWRDDCMKNCPTW